MAEGAPLLREYGVKPIEGSNPSLSASSSGRAPAARGRDPAGVELRVEINLTADWQEFYYDGQLLFEGSWSEGMSGGGITTIGAVDLFANGATSVYYDDLSLVV